MPAAQRAVLSLLLNSGLLGFLARWGWMDAPLMKLARQSLSYVPFTQLANLTGTPAMSVPLYWTADGLPLGVQLHGPFGSEALLLQLAGQLEGTPSWTRRLPDLALPA
jgi:amidase